MTTVWTDQLRQLVGKQVLVRWSGSLLAGNCLGKLKPYLEGWIVDHDINTCVMFNEKSIKNVVLDDEVSIIELRESI